MGKSRSAGWIVGTIVLIMIIFIATWFFLASPRFAAAAATLVEAKETADSNEILQLQVDGLRGEASRLEDYKEEITEIAVQIPPEARLADFTHTVAEYAAANGVTVIEMSPGVATIVTLAAPTAPPTPEPATDPAQGGEETAEQADGGATPEPTPAPTEGATPPQTPAPPEPVMQIEGFVAVPMSILVSGTYDAVLNYLQAMQVQPDRLFLVTDLEANRLAAAEAGRGRPAQADGDVEMRILGFLYVLVDQPSAQPEPAEDDEAEEPVEPTMPTSPRNPFLPLVPSGAV